MIIGIDGSRAFIKERTGIEEYSYQVIRHLIPLLKNDQVVLYVRKNQNANIKMQTDNVKVKIISFPLLWTQIGLSLEMLFNPADVLFIPAHTVPVIHAKNTIVTIHGLEYEFYPEAYSFWQKLYMCRVIKNSCRWAKKIIAVSENTKRDLVRLYKVPEEKITVVYEGYDRQMQNANIKNQNDNVKFKINEKYLLFIGRLEKRKNILGIIKTFEILKEQYKLPHKLVLVGNFGYGKDKIIEEIKNNNYLKDIILPGYVSEEEKWNLLKNADVFLFPTFYEGFGLPILEAQSAGVPVVAGNNSSIPEVVGLRIPPDPPFSKGEKDFLPLEKGELKRDLKNAQGIMSTILVDSHNAEEIADATYKMISDKALRDDIIKKGYENVKRFGWEKCANKLAKIIKNGA